MKKSHWTMKLFRCAMLLIWGTCPQLSKTYVHVSHHGYINFMHRSIVIIRQLQFSIFHVLLYLLSCCHIAVSKLTK